MTLSFIAHVATKNLGRAMANRDVDGMRTALHNGANVHGLSVQFPGDSTVFEHPFEIALTAILPLEAFELLYQHGARTSNLDGGQEALQAFFSSLPQDMRAHWPDMDRVFEFLTSPQCATEIVKESSTTEKAVTSAKDIAHQITNKFKKN